jgi:hypothetical protein
MKGFVCFCLFILLSTFTAIPQDTLVLTNGKIKTNLEFVRVDDRYVHYKNYRRKKTLNETISRELVYAVVQQNNIHIITYLQDTADVNISFVQMLDFLDGFLHSKKYYHNYTVFTIGLIIGTSSGAFLPTAITPIPPILFPGLTGTIRTDVIQNKYFPLERSDSYYYIKGFEYGVKSTTLRSAAWGSLFGFGAGFIIGVFLL